MTEEVTQQRNRIKELLENAGTRKLIAEHYNDIVLEEKNIYKKSNRALALKLIDDQVNEKGEFRVRKTKKKS